MQSNSWKYFCFMSLCFYCSWCRSIYKWETLFGKTPNQENAACAELYDLLCNWGGKNHYNSSLNHGASNVNKMNQLNSVLNLPIQDSWWKWKNKQSFVTDCTLSVSNAMSSHIWGMQVQTQILIFSGRQMTLLSSLLSQPFSTCSILYG